MNYIIGCDAHKQYSQFAVYEGNNLRGRQVRVEHERGAIREFLSEFPEGTPVALESIGNWYWIVDEMEQAGCQPLLAHPAKKNRIHATLAKYNLSLPTESDIFAPKWSSQLNQVIEQLPPETQKCLQQELELLEKVQEQIQAMEERMKERISLTPVMQLLKTIPDPGCGRYSGHCHWHRDRSRGTLLEGGAAGQLCGHGACGEKQWRQNPLWPHPERVQPLSQMGVGGSSQCPGSVPYASPLAGQTCHPPV